MAKKQTKPERKKVSNPLIQEVIPEYIETPVKKRSDLKLIRVALDKGSVEERKRFKERELNGEIRYSHGAIDGDSWYFYYEIIKK